MKVTAHPKSNAELTDKMIQAINEQTIWWSDDRMCHWFFDFSVDGIWISQTHINNELTEGNTRNNMFFFEWKYDWPGTLEQYVDKTIDYEGNKLLSGRTVEIKRVDATPSCGKEGDAQNAGCIHFPICKLDNCNGKFEELEP